MGKEVLLLEAPFSWMFCDLPPNHAYVSKSFPCIYGISTLSGRTQPDDHCWESPDSQERYQGSPKHTHPRQTWSQTPVCMEAAGAEPMLVKEAGVTCTFHRERWQWFYLLLHVESRVAPSQQYGWRWPCHDPAAMALLRAVDRERSLSVQPPSQGFLSSSVSFKPISTSLN